MKSLKKYIARFFTTTSPEAEAIYVVPELYKRVELPEHVFILIGGSILSFTYLLVWIFAS